MNILIELRQPFFSAYQKYGWEDGVEGFGINEKLVNKALLEKRKLQIRYKSTNYVISPKNALSKSNLYGSVFIARDGTKLLVIPRTAFKRIPDLEESITINTDVRLKLRDRWQEILKRGGE